MITKHRYLSIAILILLLVPGPASGEESDLAKGIAAFHSSQNEEAIFFLQKALKYPPASSLAHQILGWLYRMQGDEELAFYHLFQSLKEKGRGAEVIIPEIVELNLNRKQNEELIRLFSWLAQTSDQPLVRALSLWHSGYLYLRDGDLKRALRRFEELNFWPVWQVIGPFDNQQNSGFDEIYPPEKLIELGAEYAGKRGKVTWRKIEDFDFAGYLDLGEILRPNWGAAAYLLTYVYSPRAQPAAFRLSTDGRFKFWLNDELLLTQEKDHSFRLDQDVIGAFLKPGWNKILLKTCLDRGPWRAGLRITDPDGFLLPHLAASFIPRPFPVGKVTRTEVETGLRSCLESKKKKEELTPFEKFWLARSSLRRDYLQEAITTLEDLLSLCPRCALYRLCLGQTYYRDSKPDQALREFKRVIREDPASLLAHYELGKYYTHKKLWKKALDYIQKVVNQNPYFLPGRLYRGLILFHKNWLEDAYRDTKTAAGLHPDSAWAHNNRGVYAEEKMRWAEARDAYREALRCDYTDRDARRRLGRLYQKQGKFKEAIEVYREIIRFEPLATDVFLKLSRCYQAIKKYAPALNECAKVLRFCPYHHEARVQQGKIYYEMGDRDEAIKIWKTALKDKPDDLWLREFLNHLNPRQNLVFQTFELSGEAAEDIIDSAPPARDYPKASALILFDQAIDQVFDDGSSSQLVHQVVKILNQKGISQYSQIPVPALDTLKLEKAVTISPEGEEREATDIRPGVISLAALEAGSIVEWKYTVERQSGGWLDRHYYQTFYFQDQNPILKSQYVIALPAGKKFRLYQRGEKITSREDMIDHIPIHIWESDNNSQIYDEYDRPPERDLAELVSVSTILSWDDLARWQNSLIKDQFEIDSAIRDKLAELTGKLATKEEKIKAVYDYIVSEIRYLNLSRGIFGKKPHQAVNIFALQYGDCKDKATLMIAMLKELGITAHYAGIRVRSTGKIFRKVPYPQTNHILVYIPDQAEIEEGFFLDGTAQYLSFPHLPSDDQGVEAIILPGDDYLYLKTPVAPPDENFKEISDRIELKDDGSIAVEETITLGGSYNQLYRLGLRVKGRREELWGKAINQIAPGAVLKEAGFTGLDDLSETVAISCRYDLPHFAHLSPGRMVFSPLHRFSLTTQFARKAERIYALEFDYPRRISLEERYRLPPGYELQDLPPNTELDSAFASFRLAYAEEGDELVCLREFRLKVISLPREDYKDFRAFCLAADQAEKEHVILREKKD